jgi:hypothetical protein
MRYDIAAYGPNGGLVAVFQAHSRTGTDKEWAAEFRANLFAHVGVPDGGFFAIITPDKLYLWTEGTPHAALPSFEVDALPMFEPYFAKIGATAEAMRSLEFDSFMMWWLCDVAYFPSPEVVQGLSHTGFVDAMRDADLELGDAA